MPKLLHLSFLIVFFNLIHADTLPRIQPDVAEENVLKIDSDSEERDIIQNVTIDLCKQDFAYLHDDRTFYPGQAILYQLTTEACNKSFNFQDLETLQGYTVEVFKNALKNDTRINISGGVAPAGVILVVITRLRANAANYHQLVASRNDYSIVINPSTGTMIVQFPKGTEQGYIFYQSSTTTDRYDGIQLSYSGDCQSATIWKGLQQTETTKLYGGSTSMCSRNGNFYRDALPTFVFSRFLMVAPGKPDNCMITYGYRQYANEIIYVDTKMSGVLNSPSCSDNGGSNELEFFFILNTGVDRIYFQLFTPIGWNSELFITERGIDKSERSEIIGVNRVSRNSVISNDLCSASSTATSIQVTYQWGCRVAAYQDGLLLKWTTENPDSNVENPTKKSAPDAKNLITFLFNLSLIVFLVNIFN